MIFVDANVILRFVLEDNLLLSPKSRLIFEKIEKGETQAFISLLVISEVVFTLQRSYRLPKAEVARKLLSISQSPNIKIEKRKLVTEAFSYYLDENIDFTDAYQIALMKDKGISQIYSFDKHFNRFPQIERLES